MAKIDTYRTDPAAWAEDHFIVDRQWTAGKWSMKPAPIQLADYQRDVLREALSGKYAVVVWSEPGKSGKSTLAALASTWVTLHKARSESYVIANDLAGTGRVFKAAEYAVKHNPQLRPKIIKNELLFKDGYLKAVPADYRGEAGADPTIVTFDEVEHFMYSSQTRLVAEFKVSPTRDFSMQWFTGYGGWEGESELWADLLARRDNGQPVLTHITNSDGTPACYDCGSTFVFYSDVLRHPWQNAKWVQTQEQNLTPADFKRIILNQFVPISASAFVQPEWWQACYNPAIRPLQLGDRTPLIVSLDLAKGAEGGDNIALTAVCRWAEQDFGVKFAQAWEPTGGRFDYDTTVVPVLWWLIENFSVAQVAFDEYEATYLIKQFSNKVWCKPFSQSSDRDISDRFLYDVIASRRLHHFNDPTLNAHVYAAGANVKGENRLRIVKAGRKKIDLCVSLSMGIYRCNLLSLPPDEASQGAHAQLQKRIAQFNAELVPQILAPIVQPQPTNGNGVVKVQYNGGMHGFQLNGQPIEYGSIVEVTSEQFERLKASNPPGWWQRV